MAVLADTVGCMAEALAAALLLGGLSTLIDFATIELELQAQPLYVLARALVIGKVIGALVGARARQMLIGWVGGLMIGVSAAGAHLLLAPVLGFGALVVAWALLWTAFALLDAMLEGGGGAWALLQGAAAAAISGVLYYAIGGVWPETSPRDPSYLRLLILWTGTFLPAFIALFWRKL